MPKAFVVHFKGPSPEDTQGVGLREALATAARKQNPPLRAEFRNIKGEAMVHMLCSGENAAAVKQVADNLLGAVCDRHPLLKGKQNEFEIEGPLEVEIPSDKQIPISRVVREDELSEMVWALQGAGKLLMHQMTAQEEALREALSTELADISALAAERLSTEIGSNRMFRTVCLEEILRHGLLRQLVRPAGDLYTLCDEANRYSPPYDVRQSDRLFKIQELAASVLPAEKKESKGSDNANTAI